MEIFKREFRTITVNGRTYNSPDEMPPEVREQFEKAMSMLADRNNNGIPDVLEGAAAGNDAQGIVTHTRGVTTRLNTSGTLPSQSRPIFSASWSRSSTGGSGGSGGSNGVKLSWPTLLALLATVAVIGAAVMWYANHSSL